MASAKMHGHERQIRLKPEFSSLYPGIAPGEWVPAWAMAERLLALAQAAGVQPHERICDPRHFQFRGGTARGPGLGNLRTRRTDIQGS